MAPIILFISLSGIMCWQILFPLDKEKLVVYATLTGAVVNFILNLFLIPSYSQYGAGIATCVAECLVTITAIVFARRYVSVKLISRQNTHYYVATFLMAALLFLLNLLITDEIVYAFTGCLFSVLIYGGYLWLRGDVFVCHIQRMIIKMLNKNKHE